MCTGINQSQADKCFMIHLSKATGVLRSIEKESGVVVVESWGQGGRGAGCFISDTKPLCDGCGIT